MRAERTVEWRGDALEPGARLGPYDILEPLGRRWYGRGV